METTPRFLIPTTSQPWRTLEHEGERFMVRYCGWRLLGRAPARSRRMVLPAWTRETPSVPTQADLF